MVLGITHAEIGRFAHPPQDVAEEGLGTLEATDIDVSTVRQVIGKRSPVLPRSFKRHLPDARFTDVIDRCPHKIADHIWQAQGFVPKIVSVVWKGLGTAHHPPREFRSVEVIAFNQVVVAYHIQLIGKFGG